MLSAVDDMSVDVPPTDIPPKRGRGRPKGSGGGPGSAGGKWASMKRSLTAYYVTSGLTVSLFAPYSGMLLVMQSEVCADGWIALAKDYKPVEDALLILTKGGPIVALVSAHLPLAIGALAEAGVVQPAALEKLKMPPLSAAGVLARPVSSREPAASAEEPSVSQPLPPVTTALRVPPQLEPLVAAVVAERMSAPENAGRPEEEIRADVLLELAQAQAAESERHTTTPTTVLGALPRE